MNSLIEMERKNVDCVCVEKHFNVRHISKFEMARFLLIPFSSNIWVYFRKFTKKDT